MGRKTSKRNELDFAAFKPVRTGWRRTSELDVDDLRRVAVIGLLITVGIVLFLMWLWR